MTGGGFLHARSIYERTQEPHPHQDRTVTDAAWLTVWLIHLLAWFVIAALITND